MDWTRAILPNIIATMDTIGESDKVQSESLTRQPTPITAIRTSGKAAEEHPDKSLDCHEDINAETTRILGIYFGETG